MDKNDIAISSRSTDFNVQISAVSIHSLFTDVWTNNRNSWGVDPESVGANRSAYYPRDQSHPMGWGDFGPKVMFYFVCEFEVEGAMF